MESTVKPSRSRNDHLVALGNQLRQIRTDRGFSQEEFAAEVGLARSYYGEVERGERNVAAVNLIRIAIAMNVEVGELFPPLSLLTRNASTGI